MSQSQLSDTAGDGDGRSQRWHRQVAPADASSFVRRIQLALAWFAGVDVRILAFVPSELNFYSSLGTAVLLLDIVSGFAVCIAVGYMLQVPAGDVWWIGMAWTIILACAIERLVLQISTTRRRWLPVVLAPRLCLSAVLAVLVAVALVYRIDQGEINNYLSASQSSAIQATVKHDTAFYGGRIDSDYGEIASIRAHRDALARATAHDAFLSNCERSLTSCSITHRLGCGPYCQHYAQLASIDEAELAATKPGDDARIAAFQADISGLRALERKQKASRDQAIAGSGGILARGEALAGLEKGHPAVSDQVRYLEALFVALDLLPLGARILRILTLEDHPYEAACAAARRADGLAPKQQQADADVAEKCIDEHARADLDVERTKIRLDATARINDAHAAGGTPPESPEGQGYDPPISAWNLEEFVDRMQLHESRPVPVPPALRRGGLVGAAIIAGTALVAGLLSILTHAVLAGMAEVLIVLSLVVALAAYTRGFRRAPAWALRATLATLAIGLVLPLAIFAINV